MKKNVLLILGIGLFLILIIILGCFPKLLKEYEIKSNQVVKNNCRAIAQDIIEIKDIKILEEKSKNLVLKYNETRKNPYTKKENAFVENKKCMGCTSVNYDENTKSVTITGYDKKLEILCRTIVKIPSFVTYEREEK